MRFRHEQARKTPAKRIMSFLLMLCLLVPMIPMNARADETGGDSDTVTITLHDLYIDRKEALPSTVKLTDCLTAYEHARSIKVSKGTSLRAALSDGNDLQLGTESLVNTGVYKSGTEDEKAMTSDAKASECVWYTRDGGKNGGTDGNGARTKYENWNQEITGNIDLYTYSYRLRLITAKDTYSDLIVREGQTSGFISGEGRDKMHNISDFLKDVNTTWTDVNLGTALTDATQFNNGLTQNYTLRANGVQATMVDIECKVAVNGEWTDAGSISMDKDRIDVWGKTGPAFDYYVTDDELKQVYGKYGFGTDVKFTEQIDSTINGYFPFNTPSDKDNNLHIRQMPKYETINGTTQFRVPLVEQTSDIDDLTIYYTPHNTTKYDSNFLSYEGNRKGNGNGRDRYGWASLTDSSVLKENSFYTVSADTDKTFTDTLPSENEYHLYGSKVEYTLPLQDESGTAVTWYVEEGGDNVTIATDGTVTIPEIDQKVILTTDQSKQDADAIKVHCYILEDGQPKLVGELRTHAEQFYAPWGSNDNAKNKKRYYITAVQAESIYESYGFDSSTFKPDENDSQKYIFANANTKSVNQWNNPAKIWADVAAHDFNDGNGVKIPLVNTQDGQYANYKNVDLYYIPNNTKAAGYGIKDLTVSDGSIKKDDAFLRANSYFSITVEDKTNQFTNLPEKQYVWSGKEKEITLPYSEDNTWTVWYCSMDGKLTPIEKVLVGTKEEVNTKDNTITFTFSKISAPILITTGKHTEDAKNFYSVTAFVDIEGTWKQVETNFTKLNKEHKTSDGQYYITANELEYIYGKYGFKSSEKVTADNRIFGIANGTGDTKVWADILSEDAGHSWYYPTLKDGQTLYLYYLPNNKKGTTSFWGGDGGDKGGKLKGDEQMLADNTFYPITFADPEGKFSAADIPDTQYALTGTNKTITLPYDANVNWYVESNGKTTKLDGLKVSDDGKHATYTFESVTSAVNLTTNGVSDNEVPVSGYISVDGEWTKISSTKISTTQTDESSKKYYLTSDQLEKLFSSCDFKAENYKGITDASELSKHFPSSVNGDTNISTTAGGKIESNSWQVNTIAVSDENRAAGIAVYYLPDSSDVKDDTITTAPAGSIFHSISFKDSTGTFESKDLPNTIYRLAGENITVTAPYDKNVTWYVEEEDSGNPILTNQTQNNGEVTIPIPSFHTSVVVTTTSPKKSSIPTGRVAVNLYVAIDDTWESVTDQWTEKAGQLTGGSFTLPATQTIGDPSKFYITEDELKNIFGVYGFTGITGTENHFPHSTITKKSGSGTSFDYVWGDTPVNTLTDGRNYITLIASGDSKLGISIYYAPDLPTPTGTDKKWGKTDSAFLSANSIYYTVSASDRKKLLTEEQKETITFPETQKLEKGESTKYTLPELPKSSGLKWVAVNKNTGQKLEKSELKWEENTCTIFNILEPIQFIVSDGSKSIFYDAQITTEKLTNHGSYADPSQQKVIQDGKIKGNSTYTESLKSTADAYTVLDPDSDRAEVNLTESNHPRVYYYTFQGWQVEGTNTILKPGDSLSKLAGYEQFEQISLKAVWKAVDQNERPTTVNFYISLKCEIMDNVSNGVGPRPKDGFTETVYATRIHGTDSMNKSITLTNSMFSVLSSDDGENAYNTDAQLRQMETVGIPTDEETQGTASLTVEHFPSDEEVFENLRADANKWNKDKKIMLDGQEISRDQLTTANYAIRWYVLKYEDWDAWHIDGVLVAKEAHAVVTKTFAGNETAINKVIQGGYSISVTHDEKKESNNSSSNADTVEQDITDYNLVLKKKGSTDTNEHGYDSYDETTNTYTWILTGRQGRQYKVKENDYQIQNDSGGYDNVSYDGTYRYMIENCTDSSVVNNRWNAYDGGDITLTAEAYPTDVPSSSYQTIAFENRYVSAGHFTVQKIDSTTNRGLKNVSFTLSRVGANGADSIFLYRKNGTSEYYVRLPDEADDTVGGGKTDYTDTGGSTVVTDDQGYFYIYLPEGTYELTENTPLGYKGASKITITVDKNGKMTAVANDAKWITVDDTQSILTVKNESQLLTTVTALKQWNEHTEVSDRKSVKVELWRNGAKMDGAEYTQELNADNNWQYKWENLPLFIDGEVAQYKLREISIGNTMYDTSADTDGYADYNVSYEDAKYYEGESRPELAKGQVDKSQFTKETASWHDDSANHEQHYANHALLVVNNSLAKGYISFNKLDGLYRPLEGAEFTLYSDKDCTESVATATSQSDGTVLFASQPAGTYYMKESNAPTGYVQDTTVYTVTVSKDGEVKITKPSASKIDGETDSVMSIINKSARTLTLNKVSSTTGVTLAGAEFTISRNNKELGTFTTDEKGQTNFDGLRLENGEYTITEKKAPDGYKLLDVHVDINVDNGTVKAKTHDTAVWTLTNEGDAYTLTVKNAPISNGVLPGTGGYTSRTALAAMLGAALMCGASALAMWLRKRRGQE